VDSHDNQERFDKDRRIDALLARLRELFNDMRGERKQVLKEWCREQEEAEEEAEEEADR
jgi:hypothetical protein